MEQRDFSPQPYGILLDVAGKLVTGFGFVVGLAYITGWVYLSSYYEFFHVGWVVEFLDAQAFIRAGLLWVFCCLITAGLIYLCIRHRSYMRLEGMFYALVIGVSTLQVTPILEAVGGSLFLWGPYRVLGLISMGVFSAFCLAAGLRAVVERATSIFILAPIGFGIFWMAVMAPAMYAGLQIFYSDYVKINQITIFNDMTKRRGALLGVASGKVVISECGTHDVYVIEPNEKILFRGGEDVCN